MGTVQPNDQRVGVHRICSAQINRQCTACHGTPLDLHLFRTAHINVLFNVLPSSILNCLLISMLDSMRDSRRYPRGSSWGKAMACTCWIAYWSTCCTTHCCYSANKYAYHITQRCTAMDAHACMLCTAPGSIGLVSNSTGYSSDPTRYSIGYWIAIQCADQ